MCYYVVHDRINPDPEDRKAVGELLRETYGAVPCGMVQHGEVFRTEGEISDPDIQALGVMLTTKPVEHGKK